MKNLALKLLLLLVVGLVESAVGLPLVFLVLVCWFFSGEFYERLGLLVVSSYFLSVLWLWPWWLTLAIVSVVVLVYSRSHSVWAIVLPWPLLWIFLGIELTPRLLIYSGISLGLIFVLNLLWGKKHHLEYL